MKKTESLKKLNSSQLNKSPKTKRMTTVLDIGKDSNLKFLEGLSPAHQSKENKNRNTDFLKKTGINGVSDVTNGSNQVINLNTTNKSDSTIKPNESMTATYNVSQSLNTTLSNNSKRNTVTSNNNILSAFMLKGIQNQNPINNQNNNQKNQPIKAIGKRSILDSLLVPKTIMRQSQLSMPQMNIAELFKDKEKLKEIPENENKENKTLSRDGSQRNFASSNSAMTAGFNPPKSSNIRVIVRFRPLNEVEKDFIQNSFGFITCEFPKHEDTSVTIKSDPNSTSQSTTSVFKYDKVFNLETTQEQIYQFIGKETLQDVCNGYNGTIFSYGQSGSGKTFTMYGSDIYDDTGKGMVPRIVDELFEVIEESSEDSVFQLKFSIMQIYKEIIYDLLTGEKDLKIKESPVKGIYVEGLTEIYIDNADTFLELLQMSQEQRVVSGTKLNQFSSRSHTIFILEVTRTLTSKEITKRGVLNLVDLAGTEKVSKTGAVGETLEEAKKINLSLSALGNVIHSLTSNSDHIPYRDSKLTRILQESLGGNHKTSLIVACSPHSYHLEETISSLKFAQRVKTIKNKIKMNIKLSYEELQKINNNLRMELELANKEIGCLKDLLKGSSQVGENIVSLLQTENEKQTIQTEIANSQKKLLEANPELSANGNINIVNNSNASSVNIIFPMNTKEDIDAALKKLNLMNRRSSFLDSTVKNNLKNLFVGSKINEVESEDNESFSDDDGDTNSEYSKAFSQQGHAKSNPKRINDFENETTNKNNKKIIQSNKNYYSTIIKERDNKIKELEDKLQTLEEEIQKKDSIIKESNKDILLECKEVYQQFKKEIKIKVNNANQKDNNNIVIITGNEESYNESNHNSSKINSKDVVGNYLDTQNVDLQNLCLRVNETLTKYDKLYKLVLNESGMNSNLEKNFSSQKATTNLFNFEKLKSFLQNNLTEYESEQKVFNSILSNFDMESQKELGAASILKSIQSKLNTDLLEEFNSNIMVQNQILNNQNNILLSLFGEMMSLNQNLLQRIDVNKARGRFSAENMISFLDSYKKLNSNKIAKLLTKRNVSLMKVANARRMTMEHNEVNNLAQFQHHNSLMDINDDSVSPLGNLNLNGNLNVNNNMNSLVLNNKDLILNSRDSNLLLKDIRDYRDRDNVSEYSSFVGEINKNQNNDPKILNKVFKVMDRCKEQFGSLKDFILKSFKEAQKIKTTFQIISQDIKFIGNMSESKFYNNLRSEERNNTNNSNSSIDLNEQNEEISQKNNVNNSARNSVIPVIPNNNSTILISLRKNKNSLSKGGILRLEEIDENEELDSAGFISPRNVIVYNSNNEKPEDYNSYVNTQENNTSRTGFVFDRSLNQVEKMFRKYSMTGSASRKLDRIIFKMNSRNKSLSVEFEGGLNCSNEIGSPVFKKLDLAIGDDADIQNLEEDQSF